MSKYFNAIEQADLFEGDTVTGSPKKKSDGSKMDFLSRHRISLRLDQMIILSIVLLCAFTFVFSLGVEKGKKYSIAEVNAERQKYEKAMQMLSTKVFKKQPEKSVKEKKETVQKEKAAEKKVKSTVQEKAISKSVANPQDKIEIISVAKASKEIEKKVKTPVEKVKKANFTIQMVTYKQEEVANRMIKKLTKMGHKAFIIPSGKFLQICVDAFESRQSATKMLRKMKSDGTVPADAYVRTIPR